MFQSRSYRFWRSSTLAAILLSAAGLFAADLPANRWVELRREAAGARPGSAVRYASEARQFFLWGYMNDNPDLLQENPLMEAPEYDVVAFDTAEARWRSQLPAQWEKEWSRKLPLAYIPRTYSGITAGSERTVMRGPTEEAEGVPRPDLNIVFDQVTYRPASNSLYYFTGGLTAVYDVARRRWTDLRPKHSPPPVLGGSLAYDAVHDEIVLFGGGHVAERGADGVVRGFTGTWVYSIRENDWRQLTLATQPAPRMNTRLVGDRRNQVLVLFGGDGQQAYFADTWLFDLKARTWRESKAPGGPPARAGHFTVYDPETGMVIAGGGYNREDLHDMWGYDAARDEWHRLSGEVPAGFYLTADIAPEQRVIVLVTSTRKPDDGMSCNILFPVRTTYGYRIAKETLGATDAPAHRHKAMPKRAPEDMRGTQPDAARRAAQEERLRSLPVNQWVLLDDPGRVAPTRTWGSATFDTDRGRILYWGGGHCGYEGSDVDQYDPGEHTWIGELEPEYPERLWNHGVRPGGVTFSGAPWMDHGRRIYAYDPVVKKMVMARTIRLTAGYEPAWLDSWPWIGGAADDALVSDASSYRTFATYLYDPEKKTWKIAGPAPAGLDTLVSTPLGVMGVPVNWPGQLNDAGYLLPWSPSDPPVENPVYLYRGGRWEKLGGGSASPQNLYELTGLAYDTRRGQLILHGAGRKHNELWTFDVKTRRWRNVQPKVLVPAGAEPPECGREAAYIPGEDVFLIYSGPSDSWAYTPADNAWRKAGIPFASARELAEKSGQNRAMAYDPKRGLVLLVLGAGGDDGMASVFAMKYRK